MKTRMIVGAMVLSAVVVSLFAGAGAQAATMAPQQQGQVKYPYKISYATAATSSVAYGYYTAIGNAIMKQYPEIVVTLLPSEATTQNIEMFMQKMVNMAFIACAEAALVWNGKWQGRPEPFRDIRTMWVGFHANPITFVVDPTIKSFADLEGKKFGIMAGGMIGSAAMMYFDVMGVKPNFQPMTYAGMTEAMKAKAVLGVCIPGGPTASLKEMAAARQISYLEIDPKDLERAKAKYPGQFIAEVQDHRKYPQAKKDWLNLAFSVSESIAPSVPDEVVYKMCRAVWKDRDIIKVTYPTANRFPDFPKWTFEDTIIPIHPGAIKFYEEDLKLKVPAFLIPK